MKTKLLTVWWIWIAFISSIVSPVFADGSFDWIPMLSTKLSATRIIKNTKSTNNYSSSQKDVFTIREEIDSIVHNRYNQNLDRQQFFELKQNIQLADAVDNDIIAWEYWVFALNTAKNWIEILPKHEYLNLVTRSRQEYVLEKLLEEKDYLWLVQALKSWKYDRVITWEDFDNLSQKLEQYKKIKLSFEKNDYEWFRQAIDSYINLNGYQEERIEE